MTLTVKIRNCLLIVVAMTLAYTSGCDAAPPKGCIVEAPVELASDSYEWIGNCSEGRGSGFGILRSASAGHTEETFYGKVLDGRVLIGVIEYKNGLKAGYFSDGKLIPTSEPQVYIDAFRAGASGADYAASKYAERNDSKLKMYYEHKAEFLRDQRD